MLQRIDNLVDEPRHILIPIQGYCDAELVDLMTASKPLVPFVDDIERMVYISIEYAKSKFKQSFTINIDQMAAICLYTMDWTPKENSFYHVLNKTLREQDRNRLKPWFQYLHLIMSALTQLPKLQGTFYRGVKVDLRNEYPMHGTVYWWGLSSCTKSVAVLQSDDFLGCSGPRTLFAIETSSAVDISEYSYFRGESEVLLPPARQLKVMGVLPLGGGGHLVQLKEMEPAYPLITLPKPIYRGPSETELRKRQLVVDRILAEHPVSTSFIVT
jgi:hypothetical protein